MLILIILLITISLGTIYQTKIFLETKKERDSLKERVVSIEKDIDETLIKNRKEIDSLNDEIEKLQQRAEYIKVDQVELNKEYKYLQERNRKLEEKNLSIQERNRDRGE